MKAGGELTADALVRVPIRCCEEVDKKGSWDVNTRFERLGFERWTSCETSPIWRV